MSQMYTNITSDLRAKASDAMSLFKNGDNKKVDSQEEYNALSKILSGCEKNSEAYNYINDLMVQYQKDNAHIYQQGIGLVNGDNNTVTINQYIVDQSRERGARLAEIIVGISDGDEYPEVRRTIKSDVDSENVMEVLRGYEDKRPSASKFTNGDHFFEQLFTESSFDNKNETIKTMARHLKGYYENKPQGTGIAIAKQIDGILRKSNLTLEDMQQLDRIYMRELGE